MCKCFCNMSGVFGFPSLYSPCVCQGGWSVFIGWLFGCWLFVPEIPVVCSDAACLVDNIWLRLSYSHMCTKKLDFSAPMTCMLN